VGLVLQAGHGHGNGHIKPHHHQLCQGLCVIEWGQCFVNVGADAQVDPPKGGEGGQGVEAMEGQNVG
jgi:hypothetical protein